MDRKYSHHEKETGTLSPGGGVSRCYGSHHFAMCVSHSVRCQLDRSKPGRGKKKRKQSLREKDLLTGGQGDIEAKRGYCCQAIRLGFVEVALGVTCIRAHAWICHSIASAPTGYCHPELLHSTPSAVLPMLPPHCGACRNHPSLPNPRNFPLSRQ